MIKNNFKLYLKKRKERISISGISPFFDWKLLMITFGIIFIAGAIHIAYIYVGVTSGSVFKTDPINGEFVEVEQKMKKIKMVFDKIKVFEPEYIQQFIVDVPEILEDTTEKIEEDNFDEIEEN